jgi:PKD repeat protein
VSLTVANAFGKVTTIDKTFDVVSTLTVGMNISPRAAPIGSLISFQARSPQARFYEWNAGDGSPSVNGTSDYIQHIYKKTGVYSATLTVKNGDGSEENRISRKIYITDTDSPFALIDIKNTTGSAYEDPTACDSPDGAFVINRAEGTSIDGGNSINIDGNSTGLSYTWKYLDRIKT